MLVKNKFDFRIFLILTFFTIFFLLLGIIFDFIGDSLMIFGAFAFAFEFLTRIGIISFLGKSRAERIAKKKQRRMIKSLEKQRKYDLRKQEKLVKKLKNKEKYMVK